MRELHATAAAVRRVATRAVTIDVQAPLSLPHVFADGARLAQMLTHLVLQGLAYTEEGNVTLHASLDFGDRSMVVVQVVDEGVGMSKGRLQVRPSPSLGPLCSNNPLCPTTTLQHSCIAKSSKISHGNF